MNITEEQKKLEALEDYTDELGYRKWNAQYNKVQNLKNHVEGRPFIPCGAMVRIKLGNVLATFSHHLPNRKAYLVTSGGWNNEFDYNAFEVTSRISGQTRVSAKEHKTFLELRGE